MGGELAGKCNYFIFAGFHLWDVPLLNNVCTVHYDEVISYTKGTAPPCALYATELGQIRGNVERM